MKYAQLEWKPFDGPHSELRDGYFAEAVMDNGIKYAYIHFEPNEVGDTNPENFLFWASWDPTLPGTTDLQSLKDAAQAVHERNLKKWME